MRKYAGKDGICGKLMVRTASGCIAGVASECKCDLILLSVDREYELGG